jgi:hypothetical protein
MVALLVVEQLVPPPGPSPRGRDGCISKTTVVGALLLAWVCETETVAVTVFGACVRQSVNEEPLGQWCETQTHLAVIHVPPVPPCSHSGSALVSWLEMCVDGANYALRDGGMPHWPILMGSLRLLLQGYCKDY